MAKIVGAKVQEKVSYTTEDGETKEINKVVFRCVIKDIGLDIVGSDVERYSVQISDLPAIFGVPIKNGQSTIDYIRQFINRDCILETKATVYDGRLTNMLVGVTFKE